MLNTRMRHGITALELVVVVVIFMAVLGFLFYPRGHRESPRITQCTSNLKQMTTALQIYMQENGGAYPSAQWLLTSSNRGIDPRNSVMICPNDSINAIAGDKSPVSYGYNGLLIKADGNGVNEIDVINPVLVGAFADVGGGLPRDAPGIINGGGCRSDNMAQLAYRHNLGKIKGGMIVCAFVDGHAKVYYSAPPVNEVTTPINMGFIQAIGLGYLKNPSGGIYTRPNVSPLTAPCSVAGDYSTRTILSAAAELLNMKAGPESENRVTIGEFAGEKAGEADDSAVIGTGGNLPGPGAVAIARDAVVVITCKNSATRKLNSSELKNYWGAKQAAISYTYDSNSGTRAFFYKKIGLPANQEDTAATIARNDYDMVQKVANDSEGIGYCSAAFADPNIVDIVAIDGIGFPNPNADAPPETKYLWPSHAPTGSYPYMRTLYAQPSENPSAGARDFMEKLPVLLKAVQQGPLFKMSYFLP